MSPLTLTMCIVLGILGLVIGLIFGALPLKTELMTHRQQSYSSVLGILAMGGVLVLILLGQDIASWILIAALLIGFLVGKIPPVHTFFLTHWPQYFAPKTKKSPLRRPERSRHK